MVEPQPTKKPEWNTGGANRTEPAAGEKTSGWAVDDQPPSSYFNWLQYYTYAWLEWLNERFYKGSLEVDLIIKALQPDTSGNGGRLVLDGGNANTSGAGGYVHMTAGDGLGSTGGDIRVRAGDSDTGSGGPVDIDAGVSTSGAGGDVTIDGGDGATSGGNVLLTGGATSSGKGGNINAVAGASSSGAGGTIDIFGGVGVGAEGGDVRVIGGASDTNPGDTTVSGGDNTASGTAGYAALKGGDASVGAGGAVVIDGGDSSSGAGGDVTIDGGDGVNAEGGDITITAGPSNSDGGDIAITGGENTVTGGGGSVNVSGGDSTSGTGGSAYLNGGDAQALGGGGLARARGGDAAGANQNAGDGELSSGSSRGTGAADVVLSTAEPGVAGTGVNTPSTYITLDGSLTRIAIDRFAVLTDAADATRGVTRLVAKAKPTAPSAGDIYPDSSADQLRYYDGSRYHGLSPNVYALQAVSLAVDDTTSTEKTFQLSGPTDLKYVIPGGYLDVGAVVRIRATFTRGGTPTDEPGFNIRLGSYSGVTGAVVAQVVPNNSGSTLDEFIIEAEFIPTLVTASGSVLAASKAAATPSATTWWTDFTSIYTTSAGSIDFTGNLELYPTVVWNATGAGAQDMTCRQFSVDIL
jgi:hypothetical protein